MTVVRGRARSFATGAVIAGFAATLALNVVNPDALIARTNLSRPHVDAAYLGKLSDDAVPVLFSDFPRSGPSCNSRLRVRCSREPADRAASSAGMPRALEHVRCSSGTAGSSSVTRALSEAPQP